jgi:hypothetical protein
MRDEGIPKAEVRRQKEEGRPDPKAEVRRQKDDPARGMRAEG